MQKRVALKITPREERGVRSAEGERGRKKEGERKRERERGGGWSLWGYHCHVPDFFDTSLVFLAVNNLADGVESQVRPHLVCSGARSAEWTDLGPGTEPRVDAVAAEGVPAKESFGCDEE